MRAYGKWSDPGVPHKGWRCVKIQDRGEPSHTCEMCETTSVRYVHTMEHDDYPTELYVGCVCAGNMEQDPVGARKRESEFIRERRRTKRRQKKLEAELNRGRISKRNNWYVKTSDGFFVVVYERRPGLWGARVTGPHGFERNSRLPYATQDAAREAAKRIVTALRNG